MVPCDVFGDGKVVIGCSASDDGRAGWERCIDLDVIGTDVTRLQFLQDGVSKGILSDSANWDATAVILPEYLMRGQSQV